MNITTDLGEISFEIDTDDIAQEVVDSHLFDDAITTAIEANGVDSYEQERLIDGAAQAAVEDHMSDVVGDVIFDVTHSSEFDEAIANGIEDKLAQVLRTVEEQSKRILALEESLGRVAVAWNALHLGTQGGATGDTVGRFISPPRF